MKSSTKSTKMTNSTESTNSQFPFNLSYQVKIGIASAFVIIIIVVIVTVVLLKKKKSSPIIFNGNHTIESKIELYPETDYKKGDESGDYPTYIEITNINEKIKHNNILVKSLKVKNCKISLFSENNFTGTEMIIDDKYNGNNRLEPLLEGFKSVIISPYYQNEYELFTDNDFKDKYDEQNLSQKISKDNFIEHKKKEAKKKRYNNISEEIKLDDTYISSVRSYGLILTLYSYPDFTGKETILSDDIIYKSSLSEIARSIKIKPK